MAYLAGALALAYIVFGWPLWPLGIVLIAVLLVGDILIET